MFIKVNVSTNAIGVVDPQLFNADAICRVMKHGNGCRIILTSGITIDVDHTLHEICRMLYISPPWEHDLPPDPPIPNNHPCKAV